MEETKLSKRKKKAQHENNKSLLLSACTDLADLYVKQGQYEAAIVEYEVLVDMHKAANNQIEYAKANRAIGEAYLGLQDFEKALKHQQIYLEMATQENNDLEIQRAYATIGHTYLSWCLETQNDSTSNLNKAFKNFMKSLKIAESLTSVSKLEKVDMMARLFSNLGLVKESLGDYNHAMDLINRSIAICKQYDIYEQLSRGYISIASLYEKKQDYNEAICNYNLAIDTAKKLTGNVDLMCAALLAKSEILIILGEFHSAKQSLVKAYKLKTPNVRDRETIEHNLRVVTSLCYTEDKLVVTINDNKEMKNLYEKMGDGACELKNFSKAIEYYKLMLEYAEKCCISDKELSSCYYSLAETYKDNRQYIEAVEYFEKEYELCKDLKDNLNTLSKIIDTKEEAGADMKEIKAVYERAFTNCRNNKNLKEERRMINRYIDYLRRNNHHSDAFQQEQYLNSLEQPMSEDESSSSDNEREGFGMKVAIGNDINLDNITDQSDNSDIENQSNSYNKLSIGKRRNKNFTVKKNIKGESQLHIACINGSIPVVHHLLEQGHPVNVRDNSGWLPLHEACNHGYLEIVKLLLDKGAAINDRGGTHCGGVTPLYDAANNGHLKIVELLLDQGASIISKTDEGDTPLNILKLCHKNLNFTGEDYVLYQKLVQRMSAAMEKVGYKIECVQNLSKSNKEPVNKTNIKSNSRLFDIDDEDSHLGSTSTSEISDTDMMNEYQEVMVQLRKKSSSVDTTSKSTFNAKRPSLVTGEDEIMDDWLENDIKNTNAKKRKVNPLITPSYRSNKDKTIFSSQKKSQSPKKSLSNDLIISENSEDLELVDSHFSPLKKDDRRTFYESSSVSPCSNKRKSQASLLDAGFSRSHSKTPPFLEKQRSNKFQRSNSFNSSKSKQVRLTNFSRVQSVAEADSTTQFQNRQAVVAETLQRPIPPVTGELMIYVDVKIEGMVFRVPVLLSQVQTKTIGWLTEQAAHKYARKESTKPTLELETTTGALLSDEDPLSLLFPLGALQAEPVVARIVKLCLPPLVNRYNDVCLHSNTEPNKSLCMKLEEMSVSLSLKNHGHLAETLAPLCKALNHQTGLLDLDLSGNFLNNDCVQKLCFSLPSLVNLRILNLSSTGLLSNHLADIVKVFQTHSKPVLQNLVSLDLSDNFLRNKSLYYMAQITKHVHLTDLNLSNVKFTKKLLEDINSDTVSLELKYLENLDLSDNELDKHGIHFLISSTDCNKLKFLNLGRNDLYNEDIIGLLIDVYGGGGMLKTLNLSRSNVEDNKLYNFLRSAKSLTNINLSYNSSLTGISLRRLLECIKLEEIILIGCDNILKYFENCEGDNLLQDSQEQGLKVLKISGNFLDYQKELRILVDLFKMKYTHCYKEIYDHFLFLSSKQL